MKAGFARLDITPCLGTRMTGYGNDMTRHSVGILDPLYATAVAFDDGKNRAVVLSVDHIGMKQEIMDVMRSAIAERVGIVSEAVFIACTHIHTGPAVTIDPSAGMDVEFAYTQTLAKKLADAAALAFEDVVPAKMLYTQGKAESVAFVRRYYMKDGTVYTNPCGFQNPNVVGPVSEADECVSTLILKREGKPEIGIVNFQVHPDVVGNNKFTGDYPKFVRDTYEKLIDNSLCMYINGAQGDTNHIDCMHLSEGMCWRGYDRARYMGRKIAMAAVENYELAQELSGDKVSYGQKKIDVRLNKGTEEEIQEAYQIMEQLEQGGAESIVLPERYKGQKPTSVVYGAKRILALKDGPDTKELYLTAVAVGDVVFAGIPGEPFTDIGRGIKQNSKFTLTMPACCANGYEGYFPISEAFEQGGYEALTARYPKGTAEKLIENSAELVNSL